jgi:hypothetical protein
MPKEKRNNLAIYTLAGSILISSVIVSMNQVNAHSTSATKKEFLALKKCLSGFQKESAEFYETYSDIYDERPRVNPPSSYEPYLKEMETGYYGVAPESLLAWIADGLEC